MQKDNIDDLKKARRIFLDQLNDWERQNPFYEKKIEAINNEDNDQKYTWSIFLKTGEVIGQITVQPKDEYPNNPEIRDVGWFIDPKYQGNGYGTEAAIEVLRFMFEEVEIEKIITSAAIINVGSWKIMESLGFERTGIKNSTYFDENDNIIECYCYIGIRSH
ncbi:MAG: GNAT family N-acetyltransferase [Bacilli bacterium]|nr:GNAT family N-acetyltransferase [Bacilli bacterium]